MNNLRWMIPALGALCFSQAAMAQSFSFREVKSSLPQAYLPSPTMITDSGDVLIDVFTNGGPAAYFLHNQKLIAVAFQPYDTINYANNLETVVGVDASGNSFVQDATGKRALLMGLNGDGLYATGINKNGVVALQDTATGICYLYENGIFNSFQIANSQVGITNVNDFNDVCGVIGNSTSSYAFATHLGKIVEINVPNSSGNPGVPYAINNSGQVVGNTTIDTPGIAVGFVASPRGKVTIVNGSEFGPAAMPGPKSPLLVTSNSFNTTNVWGQNNKGQIAGQALLIYSDAFHLRPFYYGFIGDPIGNP